MQNTSRQPSVVSRQLRAFVARYIFLQPTTHNLRSMKGFTLIELMVSIFIIGVMSSVMLIRYPDSSIRIYVANITNQVALTMREAQLRGSAVDTSLSNPFILDPLFRNARAAGYGVYFATSSPGEFIHFFDGGVTFGANGLLEGNGLYDAPGETKTIVTLPKGYTIARTCVATSTYWYCDFLADGATRIGSTTITFQRPNPQPLIFVNGSRTEGSLDSVPYSAACIEIHSPKVPGNTYLTTYEGYKGHVRSAKISGIGFITTGTSSCP